MTQTQQNRPSSAIADDRIGKPFLVMDQDMRKCLVCEQLFTRQEAPKHANVVCQPRSEYPEHE